MQAIPAVGSQELGNAQARNNGQQTGFLGGPGAIDGTKQSLFNALDPGNISGHSSGGMGSNILGNVLDPGNVFGFNQAANPNGAPGAGTGMFPNLGASSMVPQTPQGAFQALHNGSGAYNNMAAMGAGGQTFNPAGHPMMPQGGMSGGGKPQQGAMPMMAKPIGPIAVGTKRT